MEKLKRVYQKIFAGKSGNDETVAFGSTAQGSTVYTKELADIQTEAFEEGIKSSLVAGEAPIWEDNNSVFYEITSQLAYLFQQGISEWNSETTYFIGSFCTIIEGDNVKLYYSLTDNNKGNDPSNDDINWKATDINVDLSKYANIDLNNITTTGKELIYTAGAPDYINKTDITINVEYTASSNGYIYLYGTEVGNIRYNLTINGIIFEWDNTAALGASGFTLMPIATNDTYKVSSSSGAINNYKGYFIPVKKI